MTSETFFLGIHNVMVRLVFKEVLFVYCHTSLLVSTVLENTHIVWSPGQGNTFTLQLEITVPEQIILYP